MPAAARTGAPRPYASPYVAGVGLGLVLLAAFVLMGRGLGASGAFASAASGAVAAAAPATARANPYFERYLQRGGPAGEWLVYELAGVVLGGFVSAALAGRLRPEIERGPRVGGRARLLLAFSGGLAMGCGAVLARGCTSGLGLTGGALLAAGSWLFLGAAFAAALGLAPLARRAWR